MDEYDEKAKEVCVALGDSLKTEHPGVCAQCPECDIVAAALRESAEEVKAAFRPMQIDNHYWSKRPCSTCQDITEKIGEPYGCIKYAKDKAAALRTAGEK